MRNPTSTISGSIRAAPEPLPEPTREKTKSESESVDPDAPIPLPDIKPMLAVPRIYLCSRTHSQLHQVSFFLFPYGQFV